jgi:hypothetical protein
MNAVTDPTRRGAPAAETRRRIEDRAETLFRSMGYQKTAVATLVVVPALSAIGLAKPSPDAERHPVPLRIGAALEPVP